MRFPVPKPVLYALRKLEQSGFDAFLVGGCVRDDYLGIPPHDYDIATAATPDEVKAVFFNHQLIETGIKHGTMTLVIDKIPLEITTFRKDGNYSDGRRPDSVVYSRNLKDDLSRRDFTMNAMAWSKKTGLIDPYLGKQDCDQGLIRCVGLPEKRFHEDALRILRALRFASALQFTIENETFIAMMEQKDRLKLISVERVFKELCGLLSGKEPSEVFRRYPYILFEVLPELQPCYHCPQRIKFHCYDVWEHTLHALSQAPNDLSVRWAVLLHDIGKPHVITYDSDGTTRFHGHQRESEKIADSLLKRLRASNQMRKEVCLLVRHHDDRIGPDNCQWWLATLGYDLFLKLLYVQRADALAHSALIAQNAHEVFDKMNALAKQMMVDGTVLHLKDMAINAQDLMDIGYAPGPLLGATLNQLFEMVLRGNIRNNKQELESIARTRLKSASVQK